MDVLMNNYGERKLTFVRGEGATLYDAAGQAYLDFTAGIAVCSLGHAHPAVAQAIAQQAQTLIHCSNLYLNPGQVRLAERLTALSGLDRAFFCNSGAEANEAAIKLARRYAWHNGDTARTEIVTLPGGFHGRTLGALSITPKPAYHQGFTPLLPDCSTPERLEAVVDAITERTAACFVEVVQGEGGVNVIPDEVLLAIQARCREVGALFVIDEVQTGVGRTGTFFAFEGVGRTSGTDGSGGAELGGRPGSHTGAEPGVAPGSHAGAEPGLVPGSHAGRRLGLQPDIVTMAKGLANGVPVGAVLARAEVAEAFTPGSHGSTFGGNPLAMAAANVVVDIVASADFLEHVKATGAYLQQALRRFSDDVSGRGLMVGMTVPDAKQFVAAAADVGVLLTAVGEHRVRFVPPLIVDAPLVDALVERLAAIR
ncbi:aminotransferase class III-fold pyridoxal phosphate-dependent enzyme [Alicyclobacillus cycloheptanicus]|uniref:Acetylornithine aminotransferase/acetylornithine/N-succinyldiaminopimelate aminotransferase n=1 Tax=Alicyclobacillus cycloheptanicus TaxID=1457 RepID=A0ABT9XIF8_9BACL|nr:aminotransferase class III-fold pyridoxal phosphate-dependent enzyme [Alicyclobacillus cycloheptanicus]MDQ0189558.1 acetylornithine aminotransferase/acetylornithine/N-succinyldiaminopimelate aminotransferase [Alicyclobacillus cycloheptanicus]WDM01612.1 aminotransferase class III-fold pyridoxal phosphate-dependent enzyme [Alicyclobacillus cycloheptanicus]